MKLFAYVPLTMNNYVIVTNNNIHPQNKIGMSIFSFSMKKQTVNIIVIS